MRNNNIDLDRDLAAVMAPLEASLVLRERLAQIPHLHPQRRARWFARWFAWLRPAPMAFDGLPRLVSPQAGFSVGMTTSVTAAMASLVLGVFLGAGSMQGTVSVSQRSSMQAQMTQQANAADDNDSVAMVYAAADLPGELP
jgi:hypothetical protein